ncbi:MAG: exodeoxyribonuclease VII large subunit [Bacteroidales bacterium]|nr:exodeoxyribonuclease VII large subunit [Bacteroidales bacterium]
MAPSAISLLELNATIREGILNLFPDSYWIIAEINDYKINRSGHCYLELIEKQKDSDAIVAKTRATIWANTFRMIRPYFETSTGRSLSEGLKIMVNVTVEFHEVYGLSLNILDIEPQYTIGDLARQRAETIAKLEKEGVINMNKGLELTLVPQKIAIISSPNAAGYKDFINQLNRNAYEYKFYTRLFPAIMQGDAAESSIIEALETIYQYEHLFEAVAIIRGGGSKSDLQCFDNYWLAFNVAQFPLPIITGIGHEQDESIIDIVAHTKLKTPTAVAEFFIDRAAEFESRLTENRNQLLQLANNALTTQHYILKNITVYLPNILESTLLRKYHQLNSLSYKFNTLAKKYLSTTKYKTNQYLSRLILLTKKYYLTQTNKVFHYGVETKKTLKNYFTHKNHQIEILTQTNTYLDPANILNRGYSLTLLNNKIVKEALDLKKGDIIKTLLKKGDIESSVTNTNKSRE